MYVPGARLEPVPGAAGGPEDTQGRPGGREGPRLPLRAAETWADSGGAGAWGGAGIRNAQLSPQASNSERVGPLETQTTPPLGSAEPGREAAPAPTSRVVPPFAPPPRPNENLLAASLRALCWVVGLSWGVGTPTPAMPPAGGPPNSSAPSTVLYPPSPSLTPGLESSRPLVRLARQWVSAAGRAEV